MKAIFYEKHGDPSVLQYGDMPDPRLEPGHVLIKVSATSLNHLDLFVRRGLPGVKIPLPHIPGCDAAGVVAEVASDVDGVCVGQRVVVDPSLTCGRCEFCVRGDASMCGEFKVLGEHTNGACAHYVSVPAQNAIPIPEHVRMEDAAAIPMVFATSWRMLIARGRLRPAEDVLVLGAAAGVGATCIQLAKITGARVLAAASNDEKLEYCKKLGADVLINYKREDFVKRVKKETDGRGVDVVVDYVGKDTWVKSLRSLVRGGRLLTCGATTGFDPSTDIRYIFYNQLEIIGSTTGNRQELMAPLKLFFQGRLQPMVARVFDLVDTADAHRLMEARGVLGKIVIAVNK